MAKLMVEIEIRDWNYEELREAVIANKKKGFEADCWFSEEDGDKILVDEAYLERSLCDDSFYAFKLIGVRP